MPPLTLCLSYIGRLGGENAAAVAMVAMLPTNLGALMPTLGLHPCSVLQMVRSWRADDLTPDIAPDMMPEVVRRVVRRLPADRKDLKSQNLQAAPRLLVSYADPGSGVRHDGGLCLGSGAVALGTCKSGRLLFAWALDTDLRVPLRSYAARSMA